jgi:hypothetical protein
MSWRIMGLAAGGVAAVAIAALVYAQLADTQTASGSISATSTSADLYICEPSGTPGPGCGSDDTGADEIIFETLEDIRPGATVEWDLRLKNVGTVDWVITNVVLGITETVDPGADCPDITALLQGNHPATGSESEAGVFILGQSGDPVNDNPAGLTGVPSFRRDDSPGSTLRNILIASGDYEDVRLRLQLSGSGTDSCDSNEWDVSWEFTVS